MKENYVTNNCKTSKIFLHLKANQYNKERYKQGEFSDYICTICNQSVHLVEAVSYKGYRLVCDDCRKKIEAYLNLTDEEFIIKFKTLAELNTKTESECKGE